MAIFNSHVSLPEGKESVMASDLMFGPLFLTSFPEYLKPVTLLGTTHHGP